MESGRARATDRGSGGLGQAEGYRFEAVLSRHSFFLVVQVQLEFRDRVQDW